MHGSSAKLLLGQSMPAPPPESYCVPVGVFWLIGAAFAILAVISVFWFYIIAWSKVTSEDHPLTAFASKDKSRALTIIGIVIGTTTLGMLRVLESEQIGTLFAGIAGFVLGRSQREDEDPPKK